MIRLIKFTDISKVIKYDKHTKRGEVDNNIIIKLKCCFSVTINYLGPNKKFYKYY